MYALIYFKNAFQKLCIKQNSVVSLFAYNLSYTIGIRWLINLSQSKISLKCELPHLVHFVEA